MDGGSDADDHSFSGAYAGRAFMIELRNQTNLLAQNYNHAACNLSMLSHNGTAASELQDYLLAVDTDLGALSEHMKASRCELETAMNVFFSTAATLKPDLFSRSKNVANAATSGQYTNMRPSCGIQNAADASKSSELPDLLDLSTQLASISAALRDQATASTQTQDAPDQPYGGPPANNADQMEQRATKPDAWLSTQPFKQRYAYRHPSPRSSEKLNTEPAIHSCS